MSDPVVLQSYVGSAAILELNRPNKHNAMTAEVMDLLTQAAIELGGRDDVRCVVLRGAGQSFCAGADINWMRAQINADRADRAVEARRLAGMLQALNRLSKPLIAQVHGAVYGGGLGLCSVCDAVFAADTARFALSETRLGIIPATIGPYVAARMTTAGLRRYFYSSQAFDAPTARSVGLVSQVCQESELETAVLNEIAVYQACAPGAVAEAKMLALNLIPAPSEAEIEHSIQCLLTRWESQEAQDGVTAFLNKSQPPWR